uniref:Uncharacterized protein n=1 Tax=Zea mays TaxID=4577 RepID=B7ZXJ8_MAIZE|nr:unknown [Zea mays]
MAAKRRTGNVIVKVCACSPAALDKRLSCPLLHALSYGQHVSVRQDRKSPASSFSKRNFTPAGKAGVAEMYACIWMIRRLEITWFSCPPCSSRTRPPLAGVLQLNHFLPQPPELPVRPRPRSQTR